MVSEDFEHFSGAIYEGHFKDNICFMDWELIHSQLGQNTLEISNEKQVSLKLKVTVV